mmetsp:Transcript_124204/g.345741  ORF Transcript_124204/g.345741 Transcript_124204/m.345741 type:complete len:231 (+) Transcript_124204:194-886(+)
MTPSPLMSNCGSQSAISSGVSARTWASSWWSMAPLPSTSKTRKAAQAACSDRQAPSSKAAATHSVYSISLEPSVSTASKTASTQLRTSSAPCSGAIIATDSASSSLEIRPLPSASMAMNCSRSPSSCRPVSCMASAVSAARRSFMLRWKDVSAETVAARLRELPPAPLPDQGCAAAAAAARRCRGSGCSRPRSRSQAGSEKASGRAPPAPSGLQCCAAEEHDEERRSRRG